MKRTISFECETGGERIDVFLAANISGLSRNAIQKLLENGNVTLSGTSVRKNYKTQRGDVYVVIQTEPDSSLVLKQDIPLDIVYEDNDVIVVNKPKGMVVHPAPGHSDGTLVNALLYHCGDSLSGIGGVIRPGIVHRIDKDTSGLIIAAKNNHSHLSLASQLSSRALTRIYDAIVCGNVKNDSGFIDIPIGRHPADRKKQAVYDLNISTRYNMKSRPAVTHYEVISRYNEYSYVRCHLETGRTHQIRVHMAYIGYPLAGDVIYGRKKSHLGLTGQCLHARILCFKHPSTNEYIELSTELPEYFIDVLDKLNSRF